MASSYYNQPPTPPQAQFAAPLSPSEERTWAMLAHLSILLNLVSGVLGLAAALVIYLVYKDRSRYVGYQALQSLVFQAIAWLGGSILALIIGAITSALSGMLIGLLCIPFACVIGLIPLGALVYGVIGGIECGQGRDFRYWLVGDWVLGMLTGG